MSVDLTKRNLLTATGAALVCPSVLASNKESVTESPNDIKKYQPNATPLAFTLDEGKVKLNPNVRMGYTRCWGCFNNCSMVIDVDKQSGHVIRARGNPYGPNNSRLPLPLATPVLQSLESTGSLEKAQCHTSLCGRGLASVESREAPHRVTSVLKRSGKRGSQEWIRIPYEQALTEILNGGDLFGEGHVRGLKSLYQSSENASKDDPLFGPEAKRLLISYNSEVHIRTQLLRRFATQFRASRGKKSAYCGAQQRIGINRVFKSAIFAGAQHAHPDISGEAGNDGCNFAIYLGTSPSNSGNSLNLLGAQLAQARTRPDFEYYVVDPILRSSVADVNNAHWLPIYPGRDTPFLFGLIQVILNKRWYNQQHLENVSQQAANKDQELHWSNASYLIACDGPDEGKFIRNDKGEFVVMNQGKLRTVSEVDHGDLWVDDQITIGNRQVKVKTSMVKLHQEVNRHSLAEYSEQTGIPVETFTDIARKFTSQGRKAAVMLSTASSSADGTITGWASAMMNLLIGSHHAKGGACYWDGPVKGMNGLFDLAKIEGGYGRADLGVSMNREGKYENSAEYHHKLANKINPYPSNQPWPETAPVENAAEMLASHVNKQPFSLQAYISWRANVLYGASGLPDEVFQGFADPHGEHGIPLVISIVDQISETAGYSDYLIPDLNHLEEYAIDRHWGSEYYGISASGQAVDPLVDKDQRGRHICMENFFIDIANSLGLAGFGDKAVANANGEAKPLTDMHQWAAYMLANSATKLTDRLPATSEEDYQLMSVDESLKHVKPHLDAADYEKVRQLISRGGFYSQRSRYQGQFQAGKKAQCLLMYNEGLTESVDCHTGLPRQGMPTYQANCLWNRKPWHSVWPEKDYPWLLSSYKSTFRSPWSVSYPRTVEFSNENFIYANKNYANRLGLSDAEQVRVSTGGGRYVVGKLKLVEDIAEKAVSIAMAFGHTGYGASDVVIDGKVTAAIKGRGNGIAYNRLIPADPSRNGPASLVDIHTYCTCRHGIPAKIEKIS